MGLDYNTTKFLLFAKSLDGVDFGRTATLGRLCLYLSRKELGHLLGNFLAPVDEATLGSFYRDDGRSGEDFAYADTLLRYLGADSIDSVDASDYESATIIHDMNERLGALQRGRYSLVLDTGTLEHIFNFPVAAQNCMDLLRPGGHLVTVLPANNFCGHGFYQFSPELLLRTFGESNGFRIRRIFVADVKSRRDWYEIRTPYTHGYRLAIHNDRETYVMMVAEKIAADATIRAAPQQSDYQALHWQGVDTTNLSRRLARLERIKQRLPMAAIDLLIPLRARAMSWLARPFGDAALQRFSLPRVAERGVGGRAASARRDA